MKTSSPTSERRRRIHELLLALIAQQDTLELLDGDNAGSLAAAQGNSAGWLERLLRPLVTACGCSAGYSGAPLSGAQLRQARPKLITSSCDSFALVFVDTPVVVSLLCGNMSSGPVRP